MEYDSKTEFAKRMMFFSANPSSEFDSELKEDRRMQVERHVNLWYTKSRRNLFQEVDRVGSGS